MTPRIEKANVNLIQERKNKRTGNMEDWGEVIQKKSKIIPRHEVKTLVDDKEKQKPQRKQKNMLKFYFVYHMYLLAESDQSRVLVDYLNDTLTTESEGITCLPKHVSSQW